MTVGDYFGALTEGNVVGWPAAPPPVYDTFQTQQFVVQGGTDGPGLPILGGADSPSGGCAACAVAPNSAAAVNRTPFQSGQPVSPWVPPAAVLTLGVGAILLIKAIGIARAATG